MIKLQLAIIKKDYIELKQNTYLFITACMPIFFSILVYWNSKSISDIESFLVLSSVYVFSIILILGTNIAEEKEYNTLEVLIFSPLNFWEVILGKSFLPILMGAFNYLMSCIYLLNFNLQNDFESLLILFLMFILSVFIGIFLGLFSKSISQVNILFIPIFIFMSLPICYDILKQKYDFFEILKFFPSGQQFAYYNNDSSFLLTLVILLIWLILFTIFNYILYKKVILTD